jgi:nickel-dependent lactate racemase
MNVDLAFGREGLTVALPDGPRYQVLHSRAAQPLHDALAAIEHALDHPIGCAPLSQMAQGRKTAAISVCDITRPAPNRVVLPPLLKRLEAAGIARDQIVILIATGLHRPATEAEILEIVGPEISQTYRVENHFAKNRSEHRDLGTTRSGTPVHIDERFCAADLHITLGFIEPHLMLGFSGGRKLVAPGLAAQETIKVIHSPKFMRDPRTFEGNVDDNPLQAELVEISRMVRHDFLVDVALGIGSPGSRPITQVFAGHPETAHRAGMDFVSEVMLEMLDEPVDAVITTAAGYPLDLTFYQAVKGVTAASHILKPGGVILLFAECSEGAGAPEFREMMERYNAADDFLTGVVDRPVTVDQWQLEKLALVKAHQHLLFYVPGLELRLREQLWGPAFDTPEAALAALLEHTGPNARIAVIPEGPYVLAKARALAFA